MIHLSFLLGCEEQLFGEGSIVRGQKKACRYNKKFFTWCKPWSKFCLFFDAKNTDMGNGIFYFSVSFFFSLLEFSS